MTRAEPRFVTAKMLLLALEEHPELRRGAAIEPYTVLRIIRAFPTAVVPSNGWDDQVRNAEIATTLGMSVRTVKRARRLLRRVLDIQAAA